MKLVLKKRMTEDRAIERMRTKAKNAADEIARDAVEALVLKVLASIAGARSRVRTESKARTRARTARRAAHAARTARRAARASRRSARALAASLRVWDAMFVPFYG